MEEPTKFTEKDAEQLVELAAKLYFALGSFNINTSGQSVAEDIIMDNLSQLEQAGHLYYGGEE